MYKLIGTNAVKRLADNACIPFANGNVDYDEYKKWLSEGNTPEPEFTDEEIQISTLNKQLQEAKAYLASTDFYMTVDKYASLTADRQLELTTKRAEARECINTLEAELIIIKG